MRFAWSIGNVTIKDLGYGYNEDGGMRWRQDVDSLVGGHGYTGHEHLPGWGLINMNARLYDPALCRFLSPDPLIQDPLSTQNFNRYSYCLNNPLKYTDESGEFLTWNIGRNGGSVGVNFTPIGIPLGFGLNFGWTDGGSIGLYGEVGARVGVTGLGSGFTLSHSLDYGFRSNDWSATTSIMIYASLGLVNAGFSASYKYDIKRGKSSYGWSLSAGMGIGNDAVGIGIDARYGTDGWSFGIGGYYDSHAWDDNPIYEPEKWNDGGNIYIDSQNNIDYDHTKQLTNNCYSYCLNDIDNGNFWGLQPGYAEGNPITSSDITLKNVLNLAIKDGRVKKPTLWNKLGFGKKGYYSAYLVINEYNDYHWYRQDKGGAWSHKPGLSTVQYAGFFIGTPFANYGDYQSGGIHLWIKKY